MSKTVVKVHLIDERCRFFRATEGAMGFDVRARLDEPLTIKKGQIVKIPLGFRVDQGFDYTLGMFVCARSGLSSKHGLMVVNGFGIIDSDYRGEVNIVFINMGDKDYTFEPFERVGQVLFIRGEDVVFEYTEHLSETLRDKNGFGHTGRLG